MKLNYFTMENEFLTVIFALEKLKSYLIGLLDYTSTSFSHKNMPRHDSLDGYSCFKISIYKFKIRKEPTTWQPITCEEYKNLLSSKIPTNDLFLCKELLAILIESWFAILINFLVIRETPFHRSKQDNTDFLTKWNTSIGMTLTFSSTILIKYFKMCCRRRD